MEAGIEHLGRATAQAVSAMIVVVEPGARSVHTAKTIHRLCREIGIPHVAAIVNKVQPATPLAAIRQALGDDLPVLGTMPYDEAILQADVEGRSPFTGQPAQMRTIAGWVAALKSLLNE